MEVGTGVPFFLFFSSFFFFSSNQISASSVDFSFLRSGMLLEKGGGECLALVETTQNDYAITITVRVPNNNKNNNNTSNSPEINDTLNKEDDNSENSNANDIITSTTNSFKILLEELVEICEILLEGQYLSVKDSCNIYIPCSHCIAKRRVGRGGRDRVQGRGREVSHFLYFLDVYDSPYV